MKLINYLTLVTCAVVLSCCNNGSAAEEKSKNALKSEANPSVIDKPSDPKMRSQALGILDHRIKNYPDTYAVVEAGVLKYEFVYDGKSKAPKAAYAGAWIDYKRDFTYDYGNYDQIEGSGRYHFRTDINQLVMIDNDKNQNPQEWNVKISGDVLILIGTATYGTNSYQMKLKRSDSKPTKETPEQ